MIEKIDRTSQRLLTMSETARYLGLSERKVWEMGKCRELPSVRIGRSVRFDITDLD
ncbi:MAG: helix-turn-helix domain-containing protein [Planctomycetaceae bacterium]|nr:helix-turn-helix domain-containing protein [Planctomycetaceae bacterium]